MSTLDLEKKYITLVKKYIKERDANKTSENKIKKIEKEKDNIIKEIDSLDKNTIWVNICEQLFAEDQWPLKIWAASTISNYNKKRANEMISDLEKKATDIQKLILKGMRNYHKI